MTLAQQLAEAQAAYHALQTGKAVAQFRDANGEFVSYVRADLAKLLAYINDLKAQIAAEAGTPLPSGPMRIFF